MYTQIKIVCFIRFSISPQTVAVGTLHICLTYTRALFQYKRYCHTLRIYSIIFFARILCFRFSLFLCIHNVIFRPHLATSFLVYRITFTVNTSVVRKRFIHTSNLILLFTSSSRFFLTDPTTPYYIVHVLLSYG